jgi:hypothetical protein
VSRKDRRTEAVFLLPAHPSPSDTHQDELPIGENVSRRKTCIHHLLHQIPKRNLASIRPCVLVILLKRTTLVAFINADV